MGSPLDRAYFGDGLCYSNGDLFAAFQVDQGYSLHVDVSDEVGAGGASILLQRSTGNLSNRA